MSEIYEKIDGGYYEIGPPDDCDACAKLDELNVDIPVCYIHITPQRCGECAGFPALVCPKCELPFRKPVPVDAGEREAEK